MSTINKRLDHIERQLTPEPDHKAIPDALRFDHAAYEKLFEEVTGGMSQAELEAFMDEMARELAPHLDRIWKERKAAC